MTKRKYNNITKQGIKFTIKMKRKDYNELRKQLLFVNAIEGKDKSTAVINEIFLVNINGRNKIDLRGKIKIKEIE